MYTPPIFYWSVKHIAPPLSHIIGWFSVAVWCCSNTSHSFFLMFRNQSTNDCRFSLESIISFKYQMLWKTTCVSVLDVSVQTPEGASAWWMSEKHTQEVCLLRLFYRLLNKQVVGGLNVFEFSQCLSHAQSSSCMSLSGPETAEIADDSFIT